MLKYGSVAETQAVEDLLEGWNEVPVGREDKKRLKEGDARGEAAGRGKQREKLAALFLA